MNRVNNSSLDHQDVFMSPPSNGNSNRISTGSNGISNTLMNGKGELVCRRSPVSQHHAIPHTTTTTTNNTQQSYYTLGSPSINTSYNSEEISDTIHSSLEEENIGELSHKFEQLQRQVEVLTETQASQDERYRRSKQENDVLLNRIHSLEDQLRELEVNSENRAQEDERRFKETMAKQMNLKSQECEQHLNANYLLQQDIIALQKDLIKSEGLIKKLRSEKESLETELQEKNNELIQCDEEIHRLKLTVKSLKDEENVKSNLISILNDELEDSHNRSHLDQQSNLSTSGSIIHASHHQNQSSSKQRSTSSRRSSVTSGFVDDHLAVTSSKALKDIDVLENSVCELRNENKHLKELNEELQAQLLQAQLEEGRSLIQEGNKSYSLADEMGDVDVQKLMEALKEQQEINAQLRRYMEEILTKIMERSPDLLDKTTNNVPSV